MKKIVVLVIYLYYNKQENLIDSSETYDIILEYLKKMVLIIIL